MSQVKAILRIIRDKGPSYPSDILEELIKYDYYPNSNSFKSVLSQLRGSDLVYKQDRVQCPHCKSCNQSIYGITEKGLRKIQDIY